MNEGGVYICMWLELTGSAYSESGVQSAALGGAVRANVGERAERKGQAGPVEAKPGDP
jgi:hypothetical protein